MPKLSGSISRWSFEGCGDDDTSITVKDDCVTIEQGSDLVYIPIAEATEFFFDCLELIRKQRGGS